MWLKMCPRCGGDLTGRQDRYGGYVCCVQCGCDLSDAQIAMLLIGDLRLPAVAAGHVPIWVSAQARLRPHAIEEPLPANAA